MTPPQDHRSLPLDQSQPLELRYLHWTRLCALADEAMSIVDAWWETDPDLVELHYRRSAFSQSHSCNSQERASDGDNDNQ